MQNRSFNSAFCLLTSALSLVFEQIVERPARIIRPARASRRGLFFHPHADRKKLALVASIFFRDPLRHRLHAFETARRIEVCALLAGMQLKAAFRALPQRFRKQGQNIAALRASRHRMSSGHVHRARSEGILPRRALRRLAFWLFCSAVLVSALTVFAVGQDVS